MEPEPIRRPDPDPTILTIEALHRETALIKELLDAKLAAVWKAFEDIHLDVHRIPGERDAALKQVQEILHERFLIMDERFRSVEKQFAERDVRREHDATSAKEAMHSAMSSAKELVLAQNQSNSLAVGKSETSTSKQIEALQTLINTSLAAVNDKVEDNRGKLTRLEGGLTGAQDALNARRLQGSGVAQIIGVVAAVVLGIISIGVSIAMAIHRI